MLGVGSSVSWGRK